ncbi:unnamed protein product [Moneuplotes crassus]|uniref:NFACT RNA-binding domain-containing protein n=1 Tax=Euplotes crassus TaxID=5936 RepID=A0AAD1XWU2_EUPCR|nr:unnamed protein product [Moneuplotes crassus]
MGKDKFENENLIKYSFPNDIWFHVEHLSSAHVYLRLEGLENIDDIPEELVQEMCQITKANSIEGSKKKEVGIVYTFASNLLKEEDMEVGAVYFKAPKAKRYIKRVSKDKEILNPLRKTKVESYPDLKEEYTSKIADMKKEAQLKKTEAKLEEKKKELTAKEVAKQKQKEKKEKAKQIEEFFKKESHDDDEEEKEPEKEEDALDDFW